MDADAEPHRVPPQQGDTGCGAYVKAPSAATYKVQRGVSCINIQEEFGGVSLTYQQLLSLTKAFSPPATCPCWCQMPLSFDSLQDRPLEVLHTRSPLPQQYTYTQRHLCRTIYFQGHIELNHQGRK